MGAIRETKVVDGVYWVGAVDWNIRHFHGYTYTTPLGTSYNAYLIRDDKIALVDTVDSGFTREMMERIRSLVDPSKIDYVVANHVEPDHSGSLVEILSIAKNAKLVCNERCRQGLEEYYPGGDWDCGGGAGGAGGGGPGPVCPPQEPFDGANCDPADVGLSCTYGATTCECVDPPGPGPAVQPIRVNVNINSRTMSLAVNCVFFIFSPAGGQRFIGLVRTGYYNCYRDQGG